MGTEVESMVDLQISENNSVTGELKVKRVSADEVEVPARPGLTVLIIDDDASVRTAVSLLLKRDGFRILEAEDASGAREIWIQYGGDIDVMLVDIMLRGRHGPDLVEELFRQGRSVAVVFATGVGNETALRLTSKISGAVTIEKPFTYRELVAAIQQARKNHEQASAVAR
jgi:FixJ family two-component response regulator